MKNMITAVIAITVAGCCTWGCRTAEPAPAPPAAGIPAAQCDPSAAGRIRFADGSANVYTFEQKEGRMTVRYEPVTAAASSSGVYDGGAPFDGPVSGPTRARFIERIRALMDDPSLRVENREMGTGRFTILPVAGKECTFLIARGEKLEAFVDFLKKDVLTGQ